MNIDSEAGLRLALRGLDQVQPPVDLWPALQARLQAGGKLRPRRDRLRLVWALAACLALAAIGLSLLRGPVAPAPSLLAALQQESQRLELRLSEQRRTGSRWSVRSAELEQGLADGLALTDLKLSAASSESEAVELWQRRVALLSTWIDLGAIGAELSDSTAPPRSATDAVHPPSPVVAEEDNWL